MAEATTFDFLCDEIEAQTDLDRLEARGTVRIAIKWAGFDPHSISSSDLAVVVEKVLPNELVSRGIEGSEALCSALAKKVGARDSGQQRETPETIFARLGRS